MSELTIDLNADLGESSERLADGSDAELMRHITSANVACGGHVGDARTMEKTIQLAVRNHVAVGAHPSYPDRAGFGRTALQISLAALRSSITDQINDLLAIAQRLDVRVAHVKPHGALYHSCNHDAEVARAVGSAVLAIDPHMIVVGQAGSACLAIYREMGLSTAAEAFADRAYEADGNLRSRTLPGAVLDSPEQAAEQALSLTMLRKVRTVTGSEIAVSAETICIHSDTPSSAAVARRIRERLAASGMLVQPFSW